MLLYTSPLTKLSKNRFRKRFALTESEKQTIREQGLVDYTTAISSALTLLLQQDTETPLPYYGNPLYKAMYATGCESRQALFKWHRISPWHQLRDTELNYVTDIVYRWIKQQLLQETRPRHYTSQHIRGAVYA